MVIPLILLFLSPMNIIPLVPLLAFGEPEADQLIRCSVEEKPVIPPTPPPNGGGGSSSSSSTSSSQKEYYALIIGPNRFEDDQIPLLMWSHADANNWSHYLKQIGYKEENIIVLGDDQDDQYGKYDGLATEFNVKRELEWLSSWGDALVVCVIAIGHGGHDGTSSFYVCYDSGVGEEGEDGNLYPSKLAGILSFTTAERVFVFMDCCHSGGFIQPLKEALGPRLFIATACREEGFGWQYDEYQHSVWTYSFLIYALEGKFGSRPATSVEEAFGEASSFQRSQFLEPASQIYPINVTRDSSQHWDGNPDLTFSLTEQGVYFIGGGSSHKNLLPRSTPPKGAPIYMALTAFRIDKIHSHINANYTSTLRFILPLPEGVMSTLTALHKTIMKLMDTTRGTG